MEKVAETFSKVILMNFLMQVASYSKTLKIKELKKKMSGDKQNYTFSCYPKKKGLLAILSDLQL